jgi:nucleoside-diphosphate-sugar epimerase
MRLGKRHDAETPHHTCIHASAALRDGPTELATLPLSARSSPSRRAPKAQPGPALADRGSHTTVAVDAHRRQRVCGSLDRRSASLAIPPDACLAFVCAKGSASAKHAKAAAADWPCEDDEMRIVMIGGTRFVGPAAVRRLLDARHEVCVAHSGAHEHAAVEAVDHLHADRGSLLGVGGAVESWGPEVLVDTFPGGATAEKAEQLAGCAARTGARVVAVSSMDVYQHCVDSGVADGGGLLSLSVDPIPLREDSRRRVGPYPGGGPAHDNVAMEDALEAAGCPAVVLRPGTIYGPHPSTREWTLVRQIALGERRLLLPDGGTQLFHRVALERVAGAIAAAVNHQPQGLWACNVVDPVDWDYSGLARQVGEILDWQWEPEKVEFSATDHPWQTGHPVLASDQRLRDVLGIQIDQPAPDDALRNTVEWLWEHRDTILKTEAETDTDRR